MQLTPEQLKYKDRVSQLFQERYDNALLPIGVRAPTPVHAQDPNDYRRETLRSLKFAYLPQNHKFYRMNMRGLPDGPVLDNFEPQVLAAVVQEARNPANVPLGQLREIKKLDALNRVVQSDFIGQESFVKQMATPGRRVTGGLLRVDPASLYRRSTP
jgi:hypothetical protein